MKEPHISIEIGGVLHELKVEEAKEIYDKLSLIFSNKEYVFIPRTVPQLVPVYPPSYYAPGYYPPFTTIC
jgi:hypothetical protein